MPDMPESGRIFGIPYNFERPSIKRMLSSYWEPGEGMLVDKPFGVGYTLNLANWRSWVVVMTAGALLWHEKQNGGESPEGPAEDEAVEVVVDD